MMLRSLGEVSNIKDETPILRRPNHILTSVNHCNYSV
jgi:hypothetical protein